MATRRNTPRSRQRSPAPTPPPAPLPRKVEAALEKELRQLVDALDEAYRRRHAPGAPDPAPGGLGGPGNFGGGTLDPGRRR